MKLTRSQKAALLKEVGNIISYFQTLDHMDVEKFINIMKEKYPSWKDAKINDLYDEVHKIVVTIQAILEEKVIDTTSGTIEKVNDVEITGGNASINILNNIIEDEAPASHIRRAYEAMKKDTDCLESDPTIFEESDYWQKIDVEDENISKPEDFSFTAFVNFNDKNYFNNNSFSITSSEFWDDEEYESTYENDFLNN